MSEDSLWWDVVDGLGTAHTLAYQHLVIILVAHRTCLATQPQEVKVAPITRAVRTMGRQLQNAFSFL